MSLTQKLCGLAEKLGKRLRGYVPGLPRQPIYISPDVGLVKFYGIGICRKCKHEHRDERVSADLIGKAAFDWQERHYLCELERPGSVEYTFRRGPRMPIGFDDRIYEAAGKGPQWLDWKSNGNVTIVYVADAALTIDLSALGASATWVAGRESTSVANSSNYLDYKITGTFISGTTPTAPAEWRLYGIAPTEDTPTWPDVFDGTDSAETVANTNILDTLPLMASGTSSATSNITYPITAPCTLAQLFGIVPDNWDVFFTHAQTAALKTDANNTNKLNYKAAQAAVA